jgi:hypothetical protein
MCPEQCDKLPCGNSSSHSPLSFHCEASAVFLSRKRKWRPEAVWFFSFSRGWNGMFFSPVLFWCTVPLLSTLCCSSIHKDLSHTSFVYLRT